MDIVFIRDLEVDTVIGIYDWEKQIRQTVRLNLDMGFDIRKAGESDAIEDTLNYKAVAKRLIAFITDSNFELVEKLAEEVCKIILNEFAVAWVKLELHKPGAVTGSSSVGVIIERGQR